MREKVKALVAERDQLRATVEAMAEALVPLAGLDLRPDGFDTRPDSQTVYARDKSCITVGDVRRAGTTLAAYRNGEAAMPAKGGDCLARIEAPTGQPPRVWTEREKHDVVEAMRRITEREAATPNYSETPNSSFSPATPAKGGEPNGKLVGWWNGITDNGERDGIALIAAERPLRAIYDDFAAKDNGDVPLEQYPQGAVDALARAGWAIVPCALPFEVLGDAQRAGVFETGNPKHGWDYLVASTRIGPAAPTQEPQAPHWGNLPDDFDQPTQDQASEGETR